MIGFIDAFFYNHFYLQSIITPHNWWVPKIRSIPNLTMSVFSFIVTDLVLIYESVSSSTNDLRITKDEWRNEESLKNELYVPPL
jgi:hypothetical protein